jgi:hypothetical protein
MWFAPIISSAQANCSPFLFFGSLTRTTGVPSALNSAGPSGSPGFFTPSLMQTSPEEYYKGTNGDEDLY